METSDKIIEISKALIEAQEELKNIPCTKENPFYKSMYAPYDKILENSKPVLKKHGLVVIQTLSTNDDLTVNITTLMLHSSGEWIKDTLRLKPTKTDPQGFGSAITYGRRYSFSAFLNIVGEEDDDGNDSSDDSANKNNKKQDPVANIKNQITEEIKTAKSLLTDKELDDMRAEYKNIKDKNNIKVFKDFLNKCKTLINKKKKEQEKMTAKAAEIFDGKVVEEKENNKEAKTLEKDLDIY